MCLFCTTWTGLLADWLVGESTGRLCISHKSVISAFGEGIQLGCWRDCSANPRSEKAISYVVVGTGCPVNQNSEKALIQVAVGTAVPIRAHTHTQKKPISLVAVGTALPIRQPGTISIATELPSSPQAQKQIFGGEGSHNADPNASMHWILEHNSSFPIDLQIHLSTEQSISRSTNPLNTANKVYLSAPCAQSITRPTNQPTNQLLHSWCPCLCSVCSINQATKLPAQQPNSQLLHSWRTRLYFVCLINQLTKLPAHPPINCCILGVRVFALCPNNQPTKLPARQPTSYCIHGVRFFALCVQSINRPNYQPTAHQ